MREKNNSIIRQIQELVRQLSDADFDVLMNELDAEDVRRKVKTGLDELDRGEGIPAADVYREIRSELQKRDI